MTSRWRRSIRILALPALIAGNLSCGQQRPYDRLCEIYEEVAAQPTSPELLVNIGARVEQELPGILMYYSVVMASPDAERYEMLQRYAREVAGKTDWQCKAIKTRFPPGAAGRQ